jgi:hypothetical protein
MERKLVTVKEWQDRLSANFTKHNSVGGSLFELFEVEVAAGAGFVKRYTGHRHLSDAAQSFALDTLASVTSEQINACSQKVAEFPLIFVDYVTTFRRLRSADILSTKCYLGPALALLRDVMDRSIHLSAIFQGKLTYTQLMGVLTEHPQKATAAEMQNLQRKQRVKVERDLISEFIGNKSDLTPDDIAELSVWNSAFDRETHGSMISSASEATRWVKGGARLKLIQSDNELIQAMFMNRYNEVSWMFHRLLPKLQSHQGVFGEKWCKKWEVLEVSFWQMEQSVADMGKQMPAAFIRFIDTKFPFNAHSSL